MWALEVVRIVFIYSLRIVDSAIIDILLAYKDVNFWEYFTDLIQCYLNQDIC